jgi:hypothetical protein
VYGASPDGENFIKVKIFNARNLHTLDGSYKSAINPSVSGTPLSAVPGGQMTENK